MVYKNVKCTDKNNQISTIGLEVRNLTLLNSAWIENLWFEAKLVNTWLLTNG